VFLSSKRRTGLGSNAIASRLAVYGLAETAIASLYEMFVSRYPVFVSKRKRNVPVSNANISFGVLANSTRQGIRAD
jgi:hypothetical protein